MLLCLLHWTHTLFWLYTTCCPHHIVLGSHHSTIVWLEVLLLFMVSIFRVHPFQVLCTIDCITESLDNGFILIHFSDLIHINRSCSIKYVLWRGNQSTCVQIDPILCGLIGTSIASKIIYVHKFCRWEWILGLNIWRCLFILNVFDNLWFVNRGLTLLGCTLLKLTPW